MKNVKNYIQFIKESTSSVMNDIYDVASVLGTSIINQYNRLPEENKESEELKSILSNLKEDIKEMDIDHLKRWSRSYKDLISYLPGFKVDESKKFESDFDSIYKKAVNRGIPNKKFWDFVERIDWLGDWKHNDDTCRYKPKYLLENIAPYFTWEEFLEFEKVYKNLYSIINKKLYGDPRSGQSPWIDEPGFDVSDDGFTDLCSSIIGAGKDFYNSVLNDKGEYKQVIDMIENDKYEENFGYIFTNIKYDNNTFKVMWDHANDKSYLK